MRQHFILGIMGVRESGPAPVDAADFVIQFEPKIIIAIKYCPFCGAAIDGKQTLGIAFASPS